MFLLRILSSIRYDAPPEGAGCKRNLVACVDYGPMVERVIADLFNPVENSHSSVPGKTQFIPESSTDKLGQFDTPAEQVTRPINLEFQQRCKRRTMVPPAQKRCYLGDREQQLSVGTADVAPHRQTAKPKRTRKAVRLFPSG